MEIVLNTPIKKKIRFFIEDEGRLNLLSICVTSTFVMQQPLYLLITCTDSLLPPVLFASVA